MKIKKLTIHGFKSFVDKTTLDFSRGASAIIGPNGCGKSNIVDAIRWVIGEQNPRHLRGKTMEDVIFNGSEARRPLGMAEVVLTFSNESGAAPAHYAGFTEIEVARRLYRSGESEYYINRVQSRLRDVQDLFADTGIGTRAYSIVEQGQVGWLVGAKPEERRAIFEEAAGINKFKNKKQAALRRLESTRDNLTRVGDIIGEVKRQLGSLKRQARKAERYREMADELKEVELTLYSLELGRLTGLLEEISGRLRGIGDEEMALGAALATKEGRAEELRAEYLSAESEFKGVRERVYELEKRIQAEERSGALVEMRLEELKRNEERLAAETVELAERMEREAGEIERLRAAKASLAAGMEAEAAGCEEASARLAELVGELGSREDANRADRTEALRLGTRLADITHAIGALIKEAESLREKEARAASEREAVLAALRENETPAAELEDRLREAVGRKDLLAGQIETEAVRLAALEAERDILDERHTRSRDELARASSRLAALEEMERNFENLRGGARSIMRRENKRGVHGILADCFTANPGYERAVEAVLGARLQFVVVESQAEGIEAIEYLKREGAGRGSFVPMKNLKPAPTPVPVQSSSYMPAGTMELAGEVNVKEGYEAIIQNLIGDALFVEDLPAAMEIWKANGIYRTLVTRDGDIIDPQGIITGGGGAGGDMGILEKRAERKAIGAEIARLESDVAELKAALDRTEASLAEATRGLEEKRERLHEAELEALGAESEHRRRAEEAARLTARLASLTGEIGEAARGLAETSARRAELSRQREELEESLRAMEEKTSDQAGEIARLAAARETLAGEVTELKVASAQSRERYGAVEKELEGRTSAAEELQRRTEARAAEIALAKEEAAAKEAELRSIKGVIEELLARIETVRHEEVAAGEALEALDGRIKALEGELREVKSRSQDLLELKGELTIEARELDMKIANIKERAREKYNLELSGHAPAPPAGAAAGHDAEALEATRGSLRERIAALGNVNLSALDEFEELETRHTFLIEQQADLESSVESLMKAIYRINRTTRERFRRSFDEINAKFKESFPKFFKGGKAELRLTEGVDILDAGIEIVVQPPGKRLQNIGLLSGGEKALTATSLVFAIFLTKPSPFCLLDEVDAPLDDANINRFNAFVREMSELSQFLLITHNKNTMEIADTLYGVTMEEPGVSRIVTLSL
ncbi:MAG: chromosome segregation protein SMC [Thermodesulfobacteriota bacterium]